MNRRELDVSALPPIAFGERTTVWWGVLGLFAIEGTMFALLAATYFYLLRNFESWPPAETPAPDLLPGTVNMILLLISIWPMRIAHRAALDEQRSPIWLWLAVCIGFGTVSLVLRAFEFKAMHCRWDTNAYGSIVWTMLGMHVVHLLASTVENVLIGVLMLRGPVERKHFVDTNVNALYWYFVVLVWLPIYAIIYFTPRIL
ncbi:MAG TPA: cytochrome c oxidase subunit 3 [Candidatus Binatia bacterium]|jgi:cytochrome c oxidase subunit I+III